MSKKIIRIPRPLGYTQMIKALKNQKENKEKDILKQKAINYLLTQYINNNNELFGRAMGFRELALTLGIGLNDVMRKYNQALRVILGSDELKTIASNVASVGIFRAQKSFLQDRQLLLAQTELLMQSQGKKHKAFVSNSVNDILKTLVAATSNEATFFKGLIPASQSPNININNNLEANRSEHNLYLTPDSAVKLITDKGHKGLLKNPTLQDEITQPLEALKIPEVIALNQKDYRIEDIPKPKDLNPKASSHEIRNELNGEIFEAEFNDLKD